MIDRNVSRAACQRVVAALVFGLFASARTALAERLALATEHATCAVETRGARVVSYCPKDAEEAVLDMGPSFGLDFTVVSKCESRHRAELVMAAEDGPLRVECVVRLGDALKLEVSARNRGTDSVAIPLGIRSSFRVGDTAGASVSGFEPDSVRSTVAKPLSLSRQVDRVYPVGPGSCEVYRLADPALNRTLYFFVENATHLRVRTLPSRSDAVCLDPMLGAPFGPLTLAAGGDATVMAGVEVRRGARLSGFAERDPRRPGSANEPTGRPFHVLYIGAHPDDFDYDFGASAAKLVRAGAKVTAIAVTDGRLGHAEMPPEALAARRLREAQAAGRVYGCERYVVLEAHDCELEVSRRWRERLGRLVRDIAPDMVITHRNVDYHPDHRAVGQNVQDLAYLLGVPHWCPDAPVPPKLPFFMYAVDGFTLPRRLRPDLVMSGEGAFDAMAAGLACHASQLFEWMPPEVGVDPATFATPSVRKAYAAKAAVAAYRHYAAPYAELLERLYGRRDEPVTVAELSEYSRAPSASEIAFLKSVPGFRWTK